MVIKMKLKRIVSTLLTAAITCSCLPIVAMADSDVETFAVDSYTSIDGTAVAHVDANIPLDTYTHIEKKADDNPGWPNYAFGYRSDALTTAITNNGDSGTYELSFYIRSATADVKITLALGTEFGSEFLLTNTTKPTGEDGIGYTTVNSISGGAYANNTLTLSTDWQKYTINFTLEDGVRNIAQRGIRFMGLNDPVDVAGLTLKRVDSGKEADIVYANDGGEWYTDKIYSDSAKFVELLSVYYRAEGVTGVKPVSDEILAVGKYAVVGKVRAGADAELTVSAGSDTSNAVNVSTSWTYVSLTLPVKKATKLSDIEFKLDGTYDFEFTGFTFTKIGDYSTDYVSLIGEATEKVDAMGGLSTYTHVQRDPGDTTGTGSYAFGYSTRRITK